VVCLAIILLCYLEFYSLRQENNINPVIIIEVLVSALTAALSIIFGIYYSIKGLLIKKTYYKCRYCKHRFTDGFLSEDVEGEDLLRTIRKKI
jgi:hypothetical protein